MFNSPEWASKEEWDTYAWYGFAIQNAQLLERYLHIILVSLFMSQNGSKADAAKWDTLYDKHGRLTLGKLLHNVRQHKEFSDNLADNIKKAVDLRNELAHNFFLPKDRDAKDLEVEVAQKKLMAAASYFSNIAPQLESLMLSLLGTLSIDRSEVENTSDSFFNS